MWEMEGPLRYYAVSYTLFPMHVHHARTPTIHPLPPPPPHTGDSLQCRCMGTSSPDTGTRLLLSLTKTRPSSTPTSTHPILPPGTVATVTVTACHPLQMEVQVVGEGGEGGAGGQRGRIHITNVDASVLENQGGKMKRNHAASEEDEEEEHSEDEGDAGAHRGYGVQVGTQLQVVVLGWVDTKEGRRHHVYECCARAAVVQQALKGDGAAVARDAMLTIKQLTEGQSLTGYVDLMCVLTMCVDHVCEMHTTNMQLFALTGTHNTLNTAPTDTYLPTNTHTQHQRTQVYSGHQ